MGEHVSKRRGSARMKLLSLFLLVAGRRLQGKIGDYKLKQCVEYKTGLWDTTDKISALSPAAPGDAVRIVQVKGDMTRITTPTIFPRALWILTKALGECVSDADSRGVFDKKAPGSSEASSGKKLRFGDLELSPEIRRKLKHLKDRLQTDLSSKTDEETKKKEEAREMKK